MILNRKPGKNGRRGPIDAHGALNLGLQVIPEEGNNDEEEIEGIILKSGQDLSHIPMSQSQLVS
jgi:hypothetical protein